MRLHANVCANSVVRWLMWQDGLRVDSCTTEHPSRRVCETSGADRGQHPSATGRSTTHNWFAVPMIRSSDLSGLSCRPFCRYHCLKSAVYTRQDRQSCSCCRHSWLGGAACRRLIGDDTTEHDGLRRTIVVNIKCYWNRQHCISCWVSVPHPAGDL